MTQDKRPLILLEEDLARIVQALEPYQATTKSRANLLMDADGHSFAQTGDPGIPPETLGAFVAASFAATRPVVPALQADELMTLTHAGRTKNLQLTTIADGVVLVTVFDQATTVGVVVFYMKPVVAKLAAIVKEVRERKAGVDLGAGFDDQASGALDDMFGGGEAAQ